MEERQCTRCPVDKDKLCFKKQIEAIASADIPASVKNENIGFIKSVDKDVDVYVMISIKK